MIVNDDMGDEIVNMKKRKINLVGDPGSGMTIVEAVVAATLMNIMCWNCQGLRNPWTVR